MTQALFQHPLKYLNRTKKESFDKRLTILNSKSSNLQEIRLLKQIGQILNVRQ